jgi:hypothetical protein
MAQPDAEGGAAGAWGPAAADGERGAAPEGGAAARRGRLGVMKKRGGKQRRGGGKKGPKRCVSWRTRVGTNCASPWAPASHAFAFLRRSQPGGAGGAGAEDGVGAASAPQPPPARAPHRRGGQRSHGGGGGGGGGMPPLRPHAPKNSSSFIMRSKVLGINAPLFSPPETTPRAGNSSALRWPAAGAATPVDALGGPLQLLGPLGGGGLEIDMSGSNLDFIRRVEAPPLHAAASAALTGDDGGGAGGGGGGDGDAGDARDGDAGGALGDAVNGFVYVGQERGVLYTSRLESENAALRARLAHAEAEVARLRGAAAPHEGEASFAARPLEEATSAER